MFRHLRVVDVSSSEGSRCIVYAQMVHVGALLVASATRWWDKLKRWRDKLKRW